MRTNFSISLSQPNSFLQKSISSPFSSNSFKLISTVALAILACLCLGWILYNRSVNKALGSKIAKGLSLDAKKKSLLLSYLTAHGKSITSLNLKNISVTDAELASIAKNCPDLKDLLLNSPHVTDAGLKTMTHLETLRLSNCPKITMKGLAGWKNLQTLELKYCDGILSLDLQTFPSLQTLNLKKDIFTTRIDDLDLFFEGKGSSSLINLFLKCSPGYDHQLKTIGTLFPELRALETLSCYISDLGLSELSNCKQLCSLHLNYLGEKIDGSGFSSLPSTLELLSLHFWKFDHLKSQALQSLKTLSSLRSFILDFNLPSEAASPNCTPFSTDPSNQLFLDLNGAIKQITWLPALFENLSPSLTKIQLKGPYIYPVHLKALNKVTSPSFDLEIKNCPQITDKDLEPIKKLKSIYSIIVKD